VKKNLLLSYDRNKCARRIGEEYFCFGSLLILALNCLILLGKQYFMSAEIKSRIHQLIDSIKDENILQMVMEDVAYYANSKDAINELSEEQLKELNEAIKEADNNDTIDWTDFKREMDEWKKR